MTAMQRMTVFCLLACLQLSACAGSPDDSPELPDMDELLLELTHEDGRDCIRIPDIDGFGTLEDDVVSVSSRFGKRHYLVTTVYRCSSLQSSMGVGFQGPQNEICGGGSSQLVSGEEICPIAHIFEFTSRDDAFAAWELAKAQREVQQRYHVPK